MDSEDRQWYPDRQRYKILTLKVLLTTLCLGVDKSPLFKLSLSYVCVYIRGFCTWLVWWSAGPPH